ncbi:hypothetical protein [Paenibacillus sp. GYB003]|uniref:hypothetical protein n=1 Tax=Paenibacillus sp. GYB003 TaxID=2994392 RepID=UPI002F968F37
MFELDFKSNSLEKRYTGGCVGMTRANGRLIVATSDNQIIALDERFRIVAKSEHRKLDFHGVATFSDNVVLVAETAVNAIGCYEVDTFARIGEIRLNAENKDIHHINDIWLEGSRLYVSMFSPYDKWYINPVQRTGAIVAIDLTGYHPASRLDVNPANHVVVKGLYMPHTVMVHQGELAYCDSMSFSAVVGKRIQLAGFTRGLAMTDDTIYIGQSRMRHVLRIPHEFSNCSLDGGIYVYNPEFRISRFVPLPAQQVYQILVVDPGKNGE